MHYEKAKEKNNITKFHSSLFILNLQIIFLSDMFFYLVKTECNFVTIGHI